MARQLVVWMFLVVVVGVVVGAPSAHAEDLWSAPAPSIRVLRRVTRHRDGARVVVHVVFVDLCAPGVSLRATRPSEGPATVRAWSARVRAAVAMNGDFFDGPPLRPLGPARGRGEWWPARSEEHYDGLIVGGPGRSVRFLDRPDDYAIGRDEIDPHDTEVVATQEHVVVAGQVRLSRWVNHGGRHARSGLGLGADGCTLVFVTVDGSMGRLAGATTAELAALMIDVGVWDGVRLDGGGSSTLFVSGRGVVNVPNDGVERTVANHVGVVIDAGSREPRPVVCRDATVERALR